MGSAVSTPLALNERNSPYIQKPELSYEFYSDHVEGKQNSRPLLSEVSDSYIHSTGIYSSQCTSFLPKPLKYYDPFIVKIFVIKQAEAKLGQAQLQLRLRLRPQDFNINEKGKKNKLKIIDE